MCAARWGLTISAQKLKAMAIRNSVNHIGIEQQVDGAIQVVPSFTYLRSVLSDSGLPDDNISRHLGKASQVFGWMLEPIFSCLYGSSVPCIMCNGVDSPACMVIQSLVYCAIVLVALLVWSFSA